MANYQQKVDLNQVQILNTSMVKIKLFTWHFKQEEVDRDRNESLSMSLVIQPSIKILK